MLEFLRARAIAGVEDVTESAYARSVAISHRGTVYTGRIEVRRARRKQALSIAVSPSLARAVPAVLSRMKHAFDLSCDPIAVAAALGELAAAASRPARAGDVRRLRACGARHRRAAGVGARRAHRARSDRGCIRRPAAGCARRGASAFSVGGAARRVRRLRHSPGSACTMARARTIIALAAAVAAGDIALQPESDVEATLATVAANSRHRRVDRALHRHAGAALARRVSRKRSRRPQGAGRRAAGARAGACGSLAPVARLRRHPSLEVRSNEFDCPLRFCRHAARPPAS